MSYRMSVNCGCEGCGIEYYVEPGSWFGYLIWSDSHGILKDLGLDTLQGIAVETESGEDFEHAEVEPNEFLCWLDKVSAHLETIRGAVCNSETGIWDDATIALVLNQLRRLDLPPVSVPPTMLVER